MVSNTVFAKRVLCIDDNPDVADAEAMLLALAGFDAQACYGGKDALLLAATFSPSVCLIDMHMPAMNGNELAEKLRKTAKERPLLLIAVTAMRADVGGNWTAMFDLHLLKPVQTESLLAAIVSPARKKIPSGIFALPPLKAPADIPLFPVASRICS